jgi:hypothetical protein
LRSSTRVAAAHRVARRKARARCADPRSRARGRTPRP